jgi:hypothetical protein
MRYWGMRDVVAAQIDQLLRAGGRPVAGSPVHEDERLTKLRERAQLEIDDAKCGEGYFAEVNDGVGLASEQARRSAWETVLRLAGESS